MAQGLNAQLEYGRELNYFDQKDGFFGSLFRRVIDAVNQVALNAGVSAVGKTSPPPKVDSIQVQGTQAGNVIMCPSEILHWTLTHNQSIKKGIKYFSEIATEPNFLQPHVIDHGTSRSSFITLPTYNNAAAKAATTPQAYYLKSYAQYPGSDPSESTIVGNLGGATQINMGGTSVTSLLPSTGSGTASPQGQQGGKGLGTVLVRPQPQAKRQITKF